MTKVSVLFCRSNNIGGWLIRTALMSDHNHVALMINGWVYDSTFSGGVAVHDKSKFFKKWDVDVIHDYCIDDHSILDMKEFLFNQMGKSYDWTAIVGMPFKRDWQRDRKWICSELVAEAFVKTGYNLPMESYRVTPRDLLFVLPTCIK